MANEITTSRHFEEKIQELINYLNMKFPSEHYNNNFYYKKGNKFYKIMKESYVYAFISCKTYTNKQLGDIQVGDVLKAATWYQPAKHVRGNIFKPETYDCFKKYTIKYLRRYFFM